MTLPVFLGDDAIPALAQLQAGDSFTLGGDEGRHAVKVKRLSPQGRAWMLWMGVGFVCAAR